MKWVTYQSGQNSPRAGVLVDDTVRGLAEHSSVLDLLTAGALDDAGADAMRRPDEVRLANEVRLLPPIPEPPSVSDALAFLDHMRNARRVTGAPPLEPVWDRVPAFYFANLTGLLGAYDDVPIAPGSAWFDLELEVAAVVGTGGRDLDPDTADTVIAGYMLMCDWSARDHQVGEMQQGIGLSKSKDSATTLGPVLVTVDELEQFRREGRLAPQLSATVNGQLLTNGRLDDMDWTFAEILAFCSRGVDLRPGDVIGSGTVPGGCLVEHLDTDPASFTRWLKPGDTVSLAGQGMGTTRQTIIPGTPVKPLTPRRGRLRSQAHS